MSKDKNADPEQLDLLEPTPDEEYIEFDANELPAPPEGEEEQEEEAPKEEKPSRAEKRIRDLVANNKKLEKELADTRAKMEQSEKASKKSVSTLQVSKAEGELAASEEKVKSARASIREAVSSGDDDAIAQAYENLANAVDLRNTSQQWLEYVKSTPDQEEADPEKEPEKREMTELETAFVKKNGSWFKKDHVMTMTVQGVHQALIETGYDPENYDDEEMGHQAYWEEVDKQMAEIFGDKYKKVTGKQARRTPVTPPSASPTGGKPSGKTQIRLSPEQLEMAKRLGIPPKRYAEEVAKRQKRSG